jgi:Na+/H+ antiporter NhaD/arsenite permease-like protein
MKKKSIVGLIILVILSACVFIIPDIVGFKATLSLKLSSIVLLSVYVILSFEILRRTTIAVAGAIVMVIIGIMTGLFGTNETFDFVKESIDYNTIGLLLGMMVLVAVLARTGIFQYVGIKICKISKGNMWKLLVLMSTFTAVTSMFIDNVTTILIMVPVIISIFRTFNLSPVPFILSQVFVSNIGGTATLIGDPPNILIGSAANIDFMAFLVYMAPTILITFVASLFLLKIMLRKELSVKPQNIEAIMQQNEKSLLTDKPMMKKALIVLLAVIALFTVHGILHIQPSIIALGGAAILLAIAKVRPDKIFRHVDWSTLIFFAGLFVIISGTEKAGMINMLANTALNVTGGDPWNVFFAVIWTSAIASSFVDNIPFTATMIPLIDILNQNENVASLFGNLAISPLWWALSLGAGLGGNGTLIGSSAGVIASGLSEKNNHTITFNQFFKLGMPFMLVTVGIGSAIIFAHTLLDL